MHIKKIIFNIIFLFLSTNSVLAQLTNESIQNQYYFDIGIEYGVDAGLGGNFGFTVMNVDRGSISHGSISILYRDDGIDAWGDLYETIGERQFSEDIIDTGFQFITVNGLIGLKITRGLHILGSIGYREASFVQKRRDETTILGRNGRYHTSYKDTDKSGIGAGAGLKFFIPLENGKFFTPSVHASTLTSLSISLGIAF